MGRRAYNIRVILKQKKKPKRQTHRHSNKGGGGGACVCVCVYVGGLGENVWEVGGIRSLKKPTLFPFITFTKVEEGGRRTKR